MAGPYLINVVHETGILLPGSSNSIFTDGPGPHFIKEFDPDFADGIGRFDTTNDPLTAKRYDSHGEAFEEWRRTSKVRPKRGDGRPNRPMTALTVEFLTLADAIAEAAPTRGTA